MDGAFATGKNTGSSNAVDTLKELKKITMEMRPLKGRDAVSLSIVSSATNFPSEKVLQITSDIQKANSEIAKCNKIISRYLSGGQNGFLKALVHIPVIGTYIENKYPVSTEKIVERMRKSINASIGIIEDDQILVVEHVQRLVKTKEFMDKLVSQMRSENWSLSSIEEALRIIGSQESENPMQNRTLEINQYLDKKMPEGQIDMQRERLLSQIDAISAQIGSAITIGDVTGIKLREVNRELSVVSAAHIVLATPAKDMQKAATDAMAATQDALMTGEGIMKIFETTVSNLEVALDNVNYLQREGIASQKGVEKLATLAGRIEKKLGESQ